MKRNPDPTQKPPFGSEIDWTDPINAGLVGCWLFNEGAGSWINNLCSQWIITPNGLAPWQPPGIYVDGAGANYLTMGNPLVYQFTGPFTLVWRGALPTTGAQNSGLFSKLSNAGWRACGLQQYNSLLYLWVAGGASTLTSGSVAFTPRYPLSDHIVGTFATGGQCYGYVNGNQVISVSSGYSTYYNSNGYPWNIMSRGSSEYTTTGTVELCGMFNRTLSDSEVAQLYAEPYGGILVPGLPKWYSIPAGVTGNPWYYYANQ